MVTGKLGSTVVESPPGGFMPKWASWSIKEASAETGYAEEYLRRLIRNGKIEAVQIGPAYLLRVSSLKQYMKDIQSTGDARTGPRSKRQR